VNTNLIMNLIHTLELKPELQLVMDRDNWSLYYKGSTTIYLSGSSNDNVKPNPKNIDPEKAYHQEEEVVVEKDNGFLWSKEKENRSSEGLNPDQAVHQAEIMEYYTKYPHVVIAEGSREYHLVEIEEGNLTHHYYFSSNGAFIYGEEEEAQTKVKDGCPITEKLDYLGTKTRVVVL
jgi:hypothetical protein